MTFNTSGINGVQGCPNKRAILTLCYPGDIFCSEMEFCLWIKKILITPNGMSFFFSIFAGLFENHSRKTTKEKDRVNFKCQYIQILWCLIKHKNEHTQLLDTIQWGPITLIPSQTFPYISLYFLQTLIHQHLEEDTLFKYYVAYDEFLCD